MSKTIEIIAENLQSKICTGTANKMDSDASFIDPALDYVKSFIISRKLILFGGQAIDYALRLKGSFLYPSDVRPDYDFLTPNSVKDAYDLVDILLAKGFTKVDAVRGLHVQTMRVRINLVPVADVGFVPLNIFEKLPTFDYMGMRIISPTYQRADMHIPMAFPFSGAPRENIFNRWKKDIKRLNLFQKFFPVEFEQEEIKFTTNKYHVNFPLDSDEIAAHGFTAYAILFMALSELTRTKHEGIIEMTCKFSGKTIETQHPVLKESDIENLPLFATHKVHSFFKSGIMYKKFLDAIDSIYTYNGVMYLNTEDVLIGVCKIKIKDSGVITTVSPHAVMTWLIVMSARDKVNANTYLAFYDSMFKILSIAEKYYYAELNSLLGIPKQTKKMQMIIDEYLHSPFVPSLNVIGDNNINTGYIIMNSDIINKFKDEPPAVMKLPANVKTYTENLPQNYYPDNGGRPEIVIFDNDLFKHNGEKIIIE